MPAMPIAESSAPMVVGIRHTSSAASTTTSWRAPEYTANGCSVATATRKTIVRPASRMSSAISLGVFWREDPSTSAIMRSRKLAPGSWVTRTTIWSERTRVPPVTAERSPPDSRITGADSPVIADSSTLAMPSTTSPSAGMSSPAETTTTSPSASPLDGTSSRPPSSPRRWAIVSERVRRSVSAWALPRPSAIASAKLANSTVNQSHAAIDHANTVGSRIASTVTSTLVTSTTNITGLRAMRRGSSLSTASRAARRISLRSNIAEDVRVIAPGAPRSARAPARGSTSARRRSRSPRAA